MCLDYELSEKESKKIIDEVKKNGYIRVYKVCKYKKTGWTSTWGTKWRKGIRKAKKIEYGGGWHGYLTKEAAEIFANYLGCCVKICFAKPEWIKHLGFCETTILNKEWGKRVSMLLPAGVFTHLAFPDWEKGTMTVKEFRKMYNEKTIQAQR